MYLVWYQCKSDIRQPSIRSDIKQKGRPVIRPYFSSDIDIGINNMRIPARIVADFNTPTFKR